MTSALKKRHLKMFALTVIQLIVFTCNLGNY